MNKFNKIKKLKCKIIYTNKNIIKISNFLTIEIIKKQLEY